MPLESGSTIEALDKFWPLLGDPLGEGDNHLRLLKSVLKAQFPGVNGEGFNTPIIAIEAEINALSGVTSNVQDQLDAITDNDNLIAPQGTTLPFYQATPPLGWTEVITSTALLSVGQGVGGTSGGTDDPINMDMDHNHGGATSLELATNVIGHTHVMNLASAFDNGENSGGQPYNVPLGQGGRGYVTYDQDTSSTDAGTTHSHDIAGSNLIYQPVYLTMILASKD